MSVTPDGPVVPGEVIPPSDPASCQHDTVIYQECLDCDSPMSKIRVHLCCWAWKAALIVPAIHIVLHLLGVPHPEVISFIP